MCGIFGIVFSDGESEPCEERLRQSAALIGHRGPDGSGVYREAGIGLAHTRLSLVDLSTRSDQPFWDPQRRYALVYNGEIYNFKELREDLADRGVQFHTTSDTEVLLQSLAVDGAERTLPRLEGMFAFAFYDTRERRLLLARDRFGIKPLLVYQDEERFLFASEVKAMQPWIKLRPDGFRIVSELMGFDEPVRNRSVFEGVQIVPPGSLVSLEIGSSPQIEQFSDLSYMIDRAESQDLEALTDEQAVDRLDELMQRSVKQMLFADAPVGALCSGGVDSSVIMAMAARHHNNLAIFHANVVGPQSEYEAARRLATHLKLDLLSIENRDDDYIELMPEVIHHYEYPFTRNPQSVPLLMLSRLIADNGVKAILTGEGSDELFLGYKRVWELYNRQLGRLERLVHCIPRIGKNLWPTRCRTNLLVGDMLSRFEQTLHNDLHRKAYAERMGRAPDDGMRTLRLLSYNLITLLHRNDSMGMAAGIEARFPFLDERLVKTAVNLPYRHKVRFSPHVWERAHPFTRDKWVVRRVADRYLPKELSQRKKLPFVAPALGRMKFRKELFQGSFVADYFQLSSRELDHLLETADQRLKVRLLMLEVWGRIFILGMAPPAVADSLKQQAYFGSAPA